MAIEPPINFAPKNHGKRTTFLSKQRNCPTDARKATLSADYVHSSCVTRFDLFAQYETVVKL
jgi:hypothetical protein